MEEKYYILLKEYILITIGCALYGFSINYFFISNHLAEGGVAGITLILYYLFKFPVGITYFIINIPLLVVGWRFVGRDFLFKTIYGTTILSLFITLTKNFKGPSDDLIIGSIYGGLLLGIGLGLVFMANGSTGGTDIIARILYKYFELPMGKTMLSFDILILTIAALIFGHKIVMYTIVAMAIVSKSIDYFQDGIKKAKGITIISDKVYEIKEKIMVDTGRGTTIINGKGGYTLRELPILYCVASKYEIIRIKNIVRNIDKDAFVTISDVSEVLGEGFNSLENK